MGETDVEAVLIALPRRVRAERLRRGLSLRAAAEEMPGVQFNTLTRFERGSNVHLTHALAFLRWVSTSADQPGRDDAGGGGA